jgi:hypothetical protein
MEVLMNLPHEVLAFLGHADLLRDEALGINPLTVRQCLHRTLELQEIDVAAELGLVVLDDANDSNPHCLITAGLAAGMIVHFCHDSEPVIRYPSLTRFLEALTIGRERRLGIDELVKSDIAPLSDQSALTAQLRLYLRREDTNAVTLLGILFPLLDPAKTEVLAEAASHDDFLIREMAARFLASHGGPAHRDLAARLASDPYPQVATPARHALRAIANQQP